MKHKTWTTTVLYMSTVKESKQPEDAFAVLFRIDCNSLQPILQRHDYDFDTSEDIFYDSKFIAPKPNTTPNANSNSNSNLFNRQSCSRNRNYTSRKQSRFESLTHIFKCKNRNTCTPRKFLLSSQRETTFKLFSRSDHSEISFLAWNYCSIENEGIHSCRNKYSTPRCQLFLREWLVSSL